MQWKKTGHVLCKSRADLADTSLSGYAALNWLTAVVRALVRAPKALAGSPGITAQHAAQDSVASFILASLVKVESATRFVSGFCSGVWVNHKAHSKSPCSSGCPEQSLYRSSVCNPSNIWLAWLLWMALLSFYHPPSTPMTVLVEMSPHKLRGAQCSCVQVHMCAYMCASTSIHTETAGTVPFTNKYNGMFVKILLAVAACTALMALHAANPSVQPSGGNSAPTSRTGIC